MTMMGMGISMGSEHERWRLVLLPGRILIIIFCLFVCFEATGVGRRFEGEAKATSILQLAMLDQIDQLGTIFLLSSSWIRCFFLSL